ncbi:MAG: hypothetical protein H7249_04485 [Chitinophagaceae bacterium]|nr:hypothetical protein [Oligoflexus sp.]
MKSQGSFLVLVFSSFACLMGGACSKHRHSVAESSAPSQAESLPLVPVLPTDPNCADLKAGEQGHSPGPGMNHCSADSKIPGVGPDQLGGR